nr:MAG TPA: hypothetical protein [Bacteriophage sp.]
MYSLIRNAPVTDDRFLLTVCYTIFHYGAEVEKRMQFPGYTIPLVGRDTSL